MNPMQGCLDCNNFTYGFDIELVDELGQSISDIDYEISLGGNNKILKKGKKDALETVKMNEKVTDKYNKENWDLIAWLTVK